MAVASIPCATTPIDDLLERARTAIRLRDQGFDDESIAASLCLEREAMDSLFRIAEAKLQRLVSTRR